MAIKEKVFNWLEKKHQISFKKRVIKNILDNSYTVVEGTIRGEDYDDAWLLALALHSKIVFDIGCNLGQSTLLMLSSQKLEKIICVDPNPMALSIASDNLIFNNLSHKAVFIASFASDKLDDKIEFHTIGSGAAGSMYQSHAESASENNASIEVPTTTLDHISSELNLVPDLIKIDVEGAEGMVLNGSLNIASHNKSKILVEMHSNAELSMKDNTQLILDWCKKTNFSAWYLKAKTKLTDASEVASRGRFHALLLPPGENFPEYLMHLEQGAPLTKVNFN